MKHHPEHHSKHDLRSIVTLFRHPARAAFLATGLALLSTGCSTNFGAPAASSAAAVAGSLSGYVHGGRQPVSGSVVTIWAAGKAGYGSAATALAHTTTSTAGTFSFGPLSGNTYLCPSTTSTTASQTLYITAVGGSPTTGIANPNAAFLTVLGDCSTVITKQPQVNVNEVTTIAGIFALQQFFTPDTTNGEGNFGTSSANNQGLLNAVTTFNNLVNANTGTANASTTVTGSISGYTGIPTVTITPEQSKINTLADILAACVNTNGASTTSPASTCGTLFSSVASPAVTDTLQAAYYLANNPTSTVSGASNIGTLYATVTSQSPFQPYLSAAPTDWTIGVTYGSTSSQTVGDGPVSLLTKPGNLAIDSIGNIWIDNYFTATAGTIGNSVTELSPAGTPLNQVLISSPGTSNGTLLAGSFSIALDPSNDVFVTSYGKSGSLGTTVAEYTAGGSTKVFTTGAGPGAVAVDGKGNAYVSTTSAAGGAADLELIPAGAASGSTATQLASGLTDSSFSTIAIDGFGTIWVADASSSKPGTTPYLCSAGAAGPPTLTANCTTPGPNALAGQGTVEPIAIDSGSNVWAGSYSSTAGALSEIKSHGGNTGFTAGTSVAASTTSNSSLLYIQKLALDGAGNIWVAGTSSTTGSVTEVTPAGTFLSPATSSGFAHTFLSPDGIAIDGSGNVWVGNNGGTTPGSATPPANFITEIVGQAVPVVTPIAAGLPSVAGGANRLATRP